MRWSFNEINQIILSEFPEAYEDFLDITFQKVNDRIEPVKATFLIPTAKMTTIDSSLLQERLERIMLKMGGSADCKSFEISEPKVYSWSKWKDKRVTKIYLDIHRGC